MEFFFLAILIVIMAGALASGYPVAFALPGSAILTVSLAALSGYLFAGGVDAFFVYGGPSVWLTTGVTNFRGVYWVIERDILIAIPLFVFMGLMLQRSKIAEDLLSAMAQLFGPVPGGLGISVIFVGALLAATTGIVGATVIAMGMISLPAMLRENYSKPLAAGAVAASGTLGQILPPSIVLLILVDQLTTAVNQASAARRALYKSTSGELLMPTEFDVGSVSAGELFMGAFVPGLILVGLYMLYVLGVALFRPHSAPITPYDGDYNRQFALKVGLALGPPLILIFLVLGSIVAGVATVNQAGAIGSAGAVVMAGYRLRRGEHNAYWPAVLALISLIALGFIVSLFNVNLRRIETNEDIVGVILAVIASASLAVALCWSGWRTLKTENTLKDVVEKSTKTTTLVFAILLGAVMFTAAFRGFGGEELVRDFLRQMPGGFWAQFSLVMGIIFVLGFFLDYIEITVVVVPIVAPILLADPSANITAVWLGVMISMNIQTSFLTPPFGFALFYLRGVASSIVKTTDIYKGVLPFIAIQLVALAVVGVYPALVNYLPNRVSLLSESALPPTNPRLQYCIEEYVFRAFGYQGVSIRSAIAQARNLDLDTLPEELRRSIDRSLDQATSAFSLMNDIKNTGEAVFQAAKTYRPLLRRVRQAERQARALEKEIAALETVISRAGAAVTETEAQAARIRRAGLTAKRDNLLRQIPAGWKAANKKFYRLQKAENEARRAYRRSTDEAYEPLMNAIAVINGVAKLRSLQTDAEALVRLLDSERPQVLLDRVRSVLAGLGGVAGVESIDATLQNARRALRARILNPRRVQEHLTQAVTLMETEIDWRVRAAREVLPGLKAYVTAIGDTIGLRGQSRLPDQVALAVAQCNATPRDIGLNF